MKMTYYVVIAFQRDEAGFLAGEEPIEAREESGARRLAMELAAKRAGVVAFSRTGDPASGDWEDAVIIYQAGEVPIEAFEAAA